jgi:hypothetical protein
MRTEAKESDPMHTDDPDGAQVESRGAVREVALPPAARTLTTLARVDYTDAFLLETPQVLDRTGEDWLRAILEDAPTGTRRRLRRGWFLLGVRLGSNEDDRLVLGWEVRRSTQGFAVLAARSVLGMEAEVLCKREPDALLVATFMQLNNPVARAVWAAIAPHHRKVLRHLISQASRAAATNSA